MLRGQAYMIEQYQAKINNSEELLNVLPALKEKVIADLSNSLAITKERIEIIKQPKFFLFRLIDSFTGKSKQEQNIVNENLFQSVESVVEIVHHLIQSQTYGFKAMTEVFASLGKIEENISEITDFSIQTRNLLDSINKDLKEKYYELEETISSLKLESRAGDHIGQAFDAWKAGRYEGLSLAGRLYSTLEDLSWGFFGPYYREPKYNGKIKADYLRNIVDKAVTQLKEDIKDLGEKRPTAKIWYTLHENAPEGSDSALQYLSDYSTINKRPFLFAFTCVETPPMAIPFFFGPERIVEGMVEEVFKLK
jgi:hypothetical protein